MEIIMMSKMWINIYDMLFICLRLDNLSKSTYEDVKSIENRLSNNLKAVAHSENAHLKILWIISSLTNTLSEYTSSTNGSMKTKYHIRHIDFIPAPPQEVKLKKWRRKIPMKFNFLQIQHYTTESGNLKDGSQRIDI